MKHITKLVCILSLCVTFIVMFPLKASADMGPKNFLKIKMSGFKKDKYYITILSDTVFSRFNSVVDDKYLINLKHSDPIYKLAQYHDKDGYILFDKYEEVGKYGSFTWGYHPPESFKVLIYCPPTDKYYVSGVYKQYAFASYYTVKYNPDGNLVLTKSYRYKVETLSWLLRILLTCIIEIFVAREFNFRKKHMMIYIIIVNIITQVLLNVCLNLLVEAAVFLYVFLEIFIAVIEAAAYAVYFKRKDNIKISTCFGYSFLANFLSCFVGIIYFILFV